MIVDRGHRAARDGAVARVGFARTGDPGWPQDTIMRIGTEGQ